MKVKLAVIFLLFMILISFTYYKVNYRDFDEAIRESNVPIEEVFHTIDFNDHKIIFYGDGDVLSVALIEKTLLGFRWVFGAGSKQFNEKNRRLTRMFSNLQPTDKKSDKELISLTFGVINDL